MDLRQPIHSDHAKTLDSAGPRSQFLANPVFVPGRLALTYSQIDRIIAGGCQGPKYFGKQRWISLTPTAISQTLWPESPSHLSPSAR